jgi:hypothetical protein
MFSRYANLSLALSHSRARTCFRTQSYTCPSKQVVSTPATSCNSSPDHRQQHHHHQQQQQLPQRQELSESFMTKNSTRIHESLHCISPPRVDLRTSERNHSSPNHEDVRESTNGDMSATPCFSENYMHGNSNSIVIVSGDGGTGADTKAFGCDLLHNFDQTPCSSPQHIQAQRNDWQKEGGDTGGGDDQDYLLWQTIQGYPQLSVPATISCGGQNSIDKSRPTAGTLQTGPHTWGGTVRRSLSHSPVSRFSQSLVNSENLVTRQHTQTVRQAEIATKTQLVIEVEFPPK